MRRCSELGFIYCLFGIFGFVAWVTVHQRRALLSKDTWSLNVIGASRYDFSLSRILGVASLEQYLFLTN